MILGVCERCSGIDSRSEGVVDVLGVPAERGERAAHAQSRFRSAGGSQPDRLHRWPSQAALIEDGEHERSA